jgi:dTDP-4-dehydrorhamnose reductase
MKKILLLGATGMLGNAVYKVLKDKHKLILGIRNRDKLKLLEASHGDTNNHEIFEFDAGKIFDSFKSKKGYAGADLPEADYVINAVGVTVPGSAANPELALFLNGTLPHILARRYGHKLINITTDCAYDGKTGSYHENSPKSPVDVYGLSKTVGEPADCLNLRTSLIGRELEGATGLLEWFLSQKGRRINGYANQIWSGITTTQYGKICDQIISDRENFPKTGTYHIFGESISKHEMLCRFKAKYNLDCEIIPVEEPRVNRSLSTIYDLNAKLNIPSFDEMLKEL